ncbi:exodeoxyribonuclease V subunit beta [Lysobacter sp. M15]|uniref:UvrD-helicase domain-containing protein n=1 Tax=Lysobacter sp. M15 TaxID=2916837 RepID=UPI001F5ABD19|nr:exodeoxyribonuclease V subunit beta [Lysobacter sp. M15]
MSATVFDTPLRARSLIEASAGTGKTWALAGLFARAVIVEKLRVPQILAVTYTVAATQELHERVRLRLQQAAALARGWQAGDPDEVEDDAPDTALLRRLIHSAVQAGESPEALRLRLSRAAREMDLAAITTIHGFCQRVLAEHALATGQPLLAAELIPGNDAQRTALAVALWRAWSRDPAEADFLQRWFGDIAGLADALRTLLAPEPLLPEAPADGCARRDAAWGALRAEFAVNGEAVREELLAALRTRVLSGAKDKRIPVDVLCDWLAAQAESSPLHPHPELWRLTPEAIEAAYLKSSRAAVPRPALGERIADWLQAMERCDLQRLHALRADARARDAADKQAFHYRDYDDLVAAVHAATQDPDVADALAAALRGQFPLVLVDEFQDTDARQWTIFERLFDADADADAGGGGGLLLVGDPKQAIYRFRGGDVETYLLAGQGAHRADPLLRNFRARPCVLAAVNALFDAERFGQDLLGKGIGYTPSEPGRAAECDAHLLRDGAPMPPLTFHAVPPRVVEKNGKPEPKDWDKPESTRIAARLCAQAIAGLLRDAQGGRASRFDGAALRPLLPRDMAVLVRVHDEAAAVRQALAEVGVPAVSAGRGSLYAGPQARSLLALLLALAAPGDERRLRAALATPLFGFDAAALCALEDDGDALRRWQDDVMRWRLRWEQHGPQAMLADVLAQQAPRLLAQAEGERELTYLLQLGELMQEARASAFDTRGLGPRGQIDWLQAAIAHADPGDETQWPRLESDAGRVQILTLHASKGLEFPLVFLPFVGIGRMDGVRGNVVDYHAGDGTRVRQWKTEDVHGSEPAWKDACERSKIEADAEDMRLLYVGLTRARDALWLCGGAFANHRNTALFRLLGRSNVPDADLQRALDGLLDLHAGLPPPRPARLPPQPAPPVPAPRTPTRTLRRDWWIHSFSQLHRQRAHGTLVPVDEAPADDERPLAVLELAPTRFGGTRFGNALHQALEHVDFARWRDCDGEPVPEGESRHLEQALRDQDYPDGDLADGVRELANLVARTLNAALPVTAAPSPLPASLESVRPERSAEGAKSKDASRQEHPSTPALRAYAQDERDGETESEHAVRLCDIPPHDRIAELEFHFTLAGTDTRALLALLHAHGIARDRRDFGAWPRLSGLMNGKIDLTCRIGGHAYVLDYKSNRLPAFDDASLSQAMAASEYELQALLYVVALHRWLRLRRGAGYDYERDIGGALYLFCRGLAPGSAQGIATLVFPRALVEGADALFAGGAA